MAARRERDRGDCSTQLNGIVARGDRIDRIQNETRTLLNALVASEANA